jgi:predicted Zn-dependent protease
LPVPAVAIVMLMTACDGDTEPPSPARPPGTTLSAADRDASLDAIERWLAAGRADNAETVARSLASRLPDDPVVDAALGRTLLMRSGEIREAFGEAAASAIAADAATALKRAEDGGKIDAETRRNLGLALEGAGRLDAAIEAYRRVDTSDPIARLYLGLALLRADRPEAAADILETLARERPDDAFVLAALAETSFRTGESQIAFERLDAAVRLAPDEPGIRIRRAALLRRAGRVRLAVESLAALPAAVRERRDVTQELAAGWLALDRPGDAGETWAARARHDPEDLAAAIEAARCFDAASRTEDAEAWLRIAEDTAPGDPRVVRARADLARPGDHPDS